MVVKYGEAFLVLEQSCRHVSSQASFFFACYIFLKKMSGLGIIRRKGEKSMVVVVVEKEERKRRKENSFFFLCYLSSCFFFIFVNFFIKKLQLCCKEPNFL